MEHHGEDVPLEMRTAENGFVSHIGRDDELSPNYRTTSSVEKKLPYESMEHLKRNRTQQRNLVESKDKRQTLLSEVEQEHSYAADEKGDKTAVANEKSVMPNDNSSMYRNNKPAIITNYNDSRYNNNNNNSDASTSNSARNRLQRAAAEPDVEELNWAERKFLDKFCSGREIKDYRVDRSSLL